MNNQKTAIVTDALWRKSLSVIRSLGKAGYEVTAMGDSVFTTGFWSRFTKHRIYTKAAAYDGKDFGKNLLMTIKKLKHKTVLFPMEDASLLWVAEHEKELEKYSYFTLPPLSSLRIAQDKAKTFLVAKRLKLPMPKTWWPKNAKAMTQIIQKATCKEFVAKPLQGSGSSGVLYISRHKLEDLTEKWKQYGSYLLQERIPPEGKAQGVSVLMDKTGKTIVSFAHERLQQYPNSGGPSTDRESISAPELIEMSLKLLDALKWKGVAMVEWKVDPRDGTPKLMEINPRFWGSLELAVRSGIDFPVLYARVSQGEKVAPIHSYTIGVRCRWFFPGEVLRYITQNKKNRESFRTFLSGFPGNTEEWDREDMRGFIATFICTVALAINPKYWKYVNR